MSGVGLCGVAQRERAQKLHYADRLAKIVSMEPPDSRYVDAAKGWCELHAFLEAEAELDKIDPKFRAHHSVLEVRWQVCANLGKWDGALDIANAIVTITPDCASGWIYKASSLNELNRHREAYETLRTAAERFASDEIIRYDLACVCCASNRVDEARTWLVRAIAAGGDQVKRRALEDPDLKPVNAKPPT